MPTINPTNDAVAPSAAPADVDGYAMGHSARERERLALQARLVAPATRRLLREAGVRAGMRVLDVGCGVGDVALLAAEVVGPSGGVVGVDRDPAALEQARARATAAGLANVAFREGDFRSLPAGDLFDAVVGRVVLIFQPDPAAALRALLPLLRPGGIVAFQEIAVAEQVGAAPLCARALGWVRTTLTHAGADPAMGLELAAAYAAAGLPAPNLRLDVLAGGAADADVFQLLAETVASLLPLMERCGVASAGEVAIATLADRLRAEAARGGCLAPCAYIGAWSRLP